MTTQPSDWAVAPLPCPWCGETPRVWENRFDADYSTWRLSCSENTCVAWSMLIEEHTQADAITAWNERTPVARELDASGDAPRAAEAGDRDGERYRWLRGNLLWAKSYDGYVRWTVEILMPEPGIHEGHPPVAETLDAAIDAAMGVVGAGEYTTAQRLADEAELAPGVAPSIKR